MASLRSTVNIFRNVPRLHKVAARGLSTRPGGHRALRPVLLGAAGVGAAAYGVYRYQQADFPTLVEISQRLTPTPVSAAAPSAGQPCQPPPTAFPAAQPSVFSQGKDHALYLWIYVKPEASPRDVAKAVACLPPLVDKVSDPKMRDEEDEIWAGVGFGPNFYKQVVGATKKDFTYRHRKGTLGEMPSSGGDIFIHAKSNQVSKLFELAQAILKCFPKDSIQSYEDIYSFVYKNGRDLSGFIDGTENPADDESREKVAVEPETGGSYVITQKWIHDLDLIQTEKDKTMEGWVGRSRADSTEISRKTITSHVARMTGGNNLNQSKQFEIVRQSMPFGNTREAGLFFIGYAASPENFEFMLDRMVGAGGDGCSDDIMRLSKNVKGTYWYFPGAEELKKIVLN